jgi:hypothetical protein
MKKYLYLCCILSIAILADDLDLGADFSAGDTISASEFNSRFNEIEKTISAVKDSYLIGSWSCTFTESAERGTFAKPTNNSFLYTLTDTLTFSETDTGSSLDSPKSWATTDASGALIQGSTGGKYSLVGNALHVAEGPNPETDYCGIRFYVNMTSENQFSLVVLQRGGCSSPSDDVVCNKL